MLNPNFKNGQNIDLQTAFASFIVVMGLLFHIDAAPGLHSGITLVTVLVGLVWFLARQFHHHRDSSHHHDGLM